uniref:Uncharacterized protein n=1 Tax=Rhizophora mucronata TaxID=61149 RepID=A0A2P2MA92_RHIMU
MVQLESLDLSFDCLRGSSIATSHCEHSLVHA